MYLLSEKLPYPEEEKNELYYLGGWCLEDIPELDNAYYTDERICPPFGHKKSEKKLAQGIFNENYPLLIKNLSEILNKYHGTDYPERIWEIIFGSWVHKFLGFFINKYFHFQKILSENSQIKKHIAVKGPYEDLLQNGERESIDVLKSTYGHSLVCKLIVNTYFKEVENIEIEHNLKVRMNRDTAYFKSVIKAFLNFGSFSKKDKFFIYKPYISPIKELALHLDCSQIPKIWRYESINDQFEPNLKARNIFKNEIQNIKSIGVGVGPLLVHMFPKIYLEGFAKALKKVEKMPWPDSPKYIYTANAFTHDEVFTIWAALKILQNKSIYIVGQHGNNYGIYSNTKMSTEMRTCDYFMSWGWSNRCGYTSKVIRGFELGKKKLVPATNSCRTILIVMRARGGWFSPSCRYFEFLKDIEKVKKVIHIISSVTDWQIVLRIRRPMAQGHRLDKYFSDYADVNGIKLTIDDGREHISHHSKKISCVLYCYDSSGVLEAIRGNTPTIALFDLDHETICEEALVDYKLMSSVGIFHHSTQSLMLHIENVSKDIKGWWKDESTQEVVRNFSKLYYSKKNRKFSKLIEDFIPG